MIDGGSTDGTVDLLREYSNQIDKWVSESDKGVYDAMNKGLDLARGSHIYFLGSDDVLLTKLESVAHHLRDSQSIYYGDALMERSGEIYDGPFSKWMLVKRNICHQAIFYPAHVFRHERFLLKYRILSDWEFNWRCVSKQLEFRYMPLLTARFGDGGLSASRDADFDNDRYSLIRRYFPLRFYLLYVLHSLEIDFKNWRSRTSDVGPEIQSRTL